MPPPAPALPVRVPVNTWVPAVSSIRPPPDTRYVPPVCEPPLASLNVAPSVSNVPLLLNDTDVVAVPPPERRQVPLLLILAPPSLEVKPPVERWSYVPVDRLLSVAPNRNRTFPVPV